jgi:6-phosphofructokinase 2
MANPAARTEVAVTTLTLNPALDTVTSIDHVVADHKMRCGATQSHPGGGGINVARVLQRLGVAVHAVHTAGGPTGEQLGRALDAEGVARTAVACAAETRTALTVRELSTSRDYRFTLPMGPLREVEWRLAVEAAQHWARPGSQLVLSGSLPEGVPADVYASLADWAKTQGLRVVLDSSGPALRPALEAGVYAFKPSLRELCGLLGQDLCEPEQWRAAARDLIRRGQAQVVAVTLGDQGAELITAERAWRAPALAVDAQTTVGAGDSFVAGLVWAWSRQAPMADALRAAVAASAAALLAPGTALTLPEDFWRLLPQVNCTEVATP